MSLTQLADQHARSEALDTQRSFIVQAPAGSGKTGLITQRYLRLLAQAKHPEDILSITFTRKAASEMRERIVSALDSATQGEPEQDHDKLTWRLACEALKRNNQQHWCLLENPQRLRIQTIDSLCASLVRQMPLLAKFGVQSGIEENATAIYGAAAESFLNAVLIERQLPDMEDPVTHLLTGLNNQLPTLIDLFTGLLARRDQWIRHFVTQERLLDKECLEQALGQFIDQQLHQLLTTAPNILGEKFFEFTQQLLNSAIDNAVCLSESHPLHRLTELQHWPSPVSDELEQWRAVADFLLTAKGELRKRWQTSEGFIVASKAKTKELKELALWQKETIADLSREFAEHSTFLVLLQKVRELPVAQYSESQWQTIVSLNQCLNYLLGFLKLEFQSGGKVDFVELALAALNALEDESGVTDLALKLDYQIQHILVDEFQDTSHGQYELLRLLTQGWQPDEQRTLFVVGDPMQSIYRFREADVGLYLGCRSYGLAEISLEPLVLTTNFRSSAGIVDWVNQTFKKVFPNEENAMLGAVPLSEAVPFNTDASTAVEFIHEFDGGVSQAQHMLDRILSIREHSPQQSIAILIRNKSHAQEIVNLLKQHQVPLEAIEMERLQERALVKNLKNIVRVLLNPADKLAATGLLRSEFCGLTLKSLYCVLNQSCHDLWDGIGQVLTKSELMSDEQNRLELFYHRIVPFIKQSGRVPVAFQAKSCWLALGGAHLNNSQRDLLDAEQFFLKIHQSFLDSAANQVAKLDELAEQLFSASVPSNENSVKIMSIHKSKGLEFDHVFIPHLERQARSDMSQLLLWQELPLDFEPTDFLVAPMKTEDEEADKIYRLLKSFNEEKQLLENGRLLYVGATRAKQRLYLLATSKWVKKGSTLVPRVAHKTSLLGQLWPVVKPLIMQQADTFEVDIDENQPEAVVQRQFRRLCNGAELSPWQPLLSLDDFMTTLTSENETIEFDWASANASLVGTLVHHYLELIAEQGVEHWQVKRVVPLADQFSQFYRQQAVEASEVSGLVDRTVRALTLMLEDPHGRWILDSHSEAKSELSLSTQQAGQFATYVIDRTFIDEQGVRWIVDYKISYHSGGGLEKFFSDELERYQKQLKNYARLFARLDQRPIRCALYLPLHQKLLSYPADFHCR